MGRRNNLEVTSDRSLSDWFQRPRTMCSTAEYYPTMPYTVNGLPINNGVRHNGRQKTTHGR